MYEIYSLKLLSGTVHCMLYIFMKVYCNLFFFGGGGVCFHMVYAFVIGVRRLVGICTYNEKQIRNRV